MCRVYLRKTSAVGIHCVKKDMEYGAAGLNYGVCYWIVPPEPDIWTDLASQYKMDKMTLKDRPKMYSVGRKGTGC